MATDSCSCSTNGLPAIKTLFTVRESSSSANIMSALFQQHSTAIRVAIIIPAHNESQFLQGLLDSVQSYGPAEAQVIVVDNGSTDGTAEIARKHGAVIVSVPSRISPSLARNMGVAQASVECEILIFLDADVLLTPEWRAEWEKTAQSIFENKEQLTGASYDVSKRPGWIERNWYAPLASRIPTTINGGNLITSHDLFKKIHGFDARLETGEDVDFCVRAQQAGAQLIINRGFRTHHEGNPKTIAAFVKRERWHGTGDVVSFSHAIASRVVLMACVFAVLNLCLFGSIACALACGKGFGLALTSFLGIVAVCWVSSKKIGGRGGLGGLGLGATVIAYFYYLGRLLSIWDAVKAKVRPRWA